MHFTNLLLPLLLAAVPASCNKEAIRDAAFLSFKTLSDALIDKYSKEGVNLINKTRIIDNYKNPAWLGRNNDRMIEEGMFVEDAMELGKEARKAEEAALELKGKLPQLQKALDNAKAAAIPDYQTDKDKIHMMQRSYDKLAAVPASIASIVPQLTHWFVNSPSYRGLPFSTQRYIYEKTTKGGGLSNAKWNNTILAIDTVAALGMRSQEWKNLPAVAPGSPEAGDVAILRANSKVYLDVEVAMAQFHVIFDGISDALKPGIPKEEDRHAILNKLLPQWYPPNRNPPRLFIGPKYEDAVKYYKTKRDAPGGHGLNDLIKEGTSRYKAETLAGLKKNGPKFN